MAGPAGRGVVVVGSLNRDFLIEVQFAAPPGETVTGAKVTTAPGGKGANQAAAAARAGARVALIGRVGDDVAGHELVASLRAADVETGDVIISESAPTGAAFVTVTPDGENSIIVSPGANALLDSADVRAREPLLAVAAVLLLQLEVSDEAIASAAELAATETVVILTAAPYRQVSQRSWSASTCCWSTGWRLASFWAMTPARTTRPPSPGSGRVTDRHPRRRRRSRLC